MCLQLCMDFRGEFSHSELVVNNVRKLLLLHIAARGCGVSHKNGQVCSIRFGKKGVVIYLLDYLIFDDCFR